MRWNENDTYEFVKLYLSYEFLWNRDHDEYNLKRKRQEAYQEIISKFSKISNIEFADEEEVKIKIKNLRSTYIQELAKIKKRSRSGYVYVPTIKWFAAFHRCFNGMQRRKNYDEDQEDQNQSEQKVWLDADSEETPDFVNENTDNEGNKDPFISEMNNDYLVLLKTEPGEEKTNKESKPYKIKKKRLKRKRSLSTDQSDNTFRGSMDSNLEGKDDEFEIYGKYIASQLRSMNLQRALRVQLEIQSLVSEARIVDLEKRQD